MKNSVSKGGRFLRHTHASRRAFSVIFVPLVAIVFNAAVIAAPSDEISAAVFAGGSADTAQASRAVFLRGFNSVALRVKPRDLPEYVIAAINLRPDLAPQIVAVTVKAVVKGSQTKPQVLCGLIERIVSAAIAADSQTAASIAKAAAAASPTLRHCILSAAIGAAPQAKDQIIAAIAAKTVPLAFLTSSVSADGEFSSTSSPLNSANIFDAGNSGVVVSPEQPPSH